MLCRFLLMVLMLMAINLCSLLLRPSRFIPRSQAYSTIIFFFPFSLSSTTTIVARFYLLKATYLSPTPTTGESFGN